MAFTDQQINEVWAKGRPVAGNEPSIWRLDECGAWIGREYYGNRNSEYGWEIDHISPSANGGSDVLSNLRPLHWENNANKSDGRLSCVMTASGIHNQRRA